MNRILIVGGGFMGYSLSMALAARADKHEISIVEPNLNNKTLIQNKPSDFILYDDNVAKNIYYYESTPSLRHKSNAGTAFTWRAGSDMTSIVSSR